MNLVNCPRGTRSDLIKKIENFLLIISNEQLVERTLETNNL